VDYSPIATPALVALALATFDKPSVRDWLVSGTAKASRFTCTRSLHEEQAALRGTTKQPFFVNYWWGAKRLALCSEPGSKACEVDATLFFEAQDGARLAIHIEYKRKREKLNEEQAKAYPLRAAHFAVRDFCPPQVPFHDNWLTLLICAEADLTNPVISHFERVICHEEAARIVPGYSTYV